MKRLCSAGGTAFILIAVAYTVIFLSFAIVKPDFGASLPVMAEGFLTGLKPLFVIMTICSTFAGILYVPAILAIYLALRDLNKSLIIVATALILAMVPLILVQNTINLAILSVSGNFTEAGTEALRIGYLTASTVALAASFKAELFIVTLLSMATILISLAMSGSVFGEFVVYFGIVAGVINLLSQVLSITMGSHHEATSAVSFFGLILNIIWFVLVGYKLIKWPVSVPAK